MVEICKVSKLHVGFEPRGLLVFLQTAGSVCPFKVPYRHHLIHCGPPSEEDIALLSGLED